MIVTYKENISALRWAGFSSAIRNACWNLDIELDMHIEKSLLKEHCYFKLTAEEQKIRNFIKWMNEAINEYNERRA